MDRSIIPIGIYRTLRYPIPIDYNVVMVGLLNPIPIFPF